MRLEIVTIRIVSEFTTQREREKPLVIHLSLRDIKQGNGDMVTPETPPLPFYYIRFSMNCVSISQSTFCHLFLIFL